MATGAAIAVAAIAGATAQRQHVVARRGETRARGAAFAERTRLARASALLESQEQAGIAKAAKALDRTRGKRLGRRSLISGEETGIAPATGSQLGTATQLG